MSDSIMIRRTTIRLVKDDITNLEIESFVFYARPDLKLGSGFGTAISVRGGPTIQEELNTLGERAVTDVVLTSAGDLRAKYIVHAVGPSFQEPDLEAKLETTITNVLTTAVRRGIKRLAFPAMGAGFYGVPLPVCADIMLRAITKYVESGEGRFEEIVICVLDNRELKPFRDQLSRPVNA